MNKSRYHIKSVLVILAFALFVNACFQQFESAEVKIEGGNLIFTHPRIKQAFESGEVCVFGEISVQRKAPEGDFREMWRVSNTRTGFSEDTPAMNKPYVIYGESLPQTRVTIDPKPLLEGEYRARGVIGVYNQKRELLSDLSFTSEFVLESDGAGNFTVSKPAVK